MTWGVTAVAGASVVGGYLSSQANKSAANTSADAQRYAADQAAAAAKFNPLGVTTRFGNSYFNRSNDPTQDFTTWASSQGIDPSTVTGSDLTALQNRYNTEVPRAQKDITSQGYNLSPELKAIQDRIMAGASSYDPTQYANASQDVFNMGRGYMATSPQQAATDYYNQQRQLLAPGRERDLATIQNAQFQTGRSGLGVGGTSAGYTAGGPGLMQSNPQLAAYYNANAGVDANLAAQADQYGRERYNYGLNLLGQAPGLFTSGYAPLQTQLGLSSTIEQLGQSPLDISAQLAGKSATAGANVGQALLSGGTNAARTAQAGNQYSFAGGVLQGAGSNTALNNWFQNQINYGGTPQGGYAQQNAYLQGAYANPQTQQQQMLAAQMKDF
jgi:hypothetical protein